MATSEWHCIDMEERANFHRYENRVRSMLGITARNVSDPNSRIGYRSTLVVVRSKSSSARLIGGGSSTVLTQRCDKSAFLLEGQDYFFPLPIEW